MTDLIKNLPVALNRRSFVKKTLATAGTTAAGAALLTSSKSSLAKEMMDSPGHLTRGDAALLRFAAAAEILETDFWVQYNELGGVQDNEFPGGGGSGSSAYTSALQQLDGDMPTYVHDNTDDE